ncbi:hypothetical protein KDA14_05700 [Candidatus Saccharibacteria bacterium]|nr:hypothetical protein [Candidatus Saccharibacteria bacterium]
MDTTNVKPWYQSKTIWSGLVVVVLSLFGVQTTGMDFDHIAEVVMQLITAMAGIMAVYGRFSADTVVVKPTPGQPIPTAPTQTPSSYYPPNAGPYNESSYTPPYPDTAYPPMQSPGSAVQACPYCHRTYGSNMPVAVNAAQG